MIHIENINVTINAQALSDEAKTSHTLDLELLKAMTESLFAEQTEEELDSEGEVQPPINPARMNSLLMQVNSWHAVCGVLHEVCPSWMDAPGSAKENAVAAIRAMAKAR